ncbi:hypothetical protein WR25_13237 [Diploscapter pachys]|uniref:Uncharacterized protein n=1 Tax=Diploscapter pachys TaxID=2018661 RepID=A0A2A2K389_9BILA|nr:hypothetical protein WR25_13237 [Diploscapter pachys]
METGELQPACGQRVEVRRPYLAAERAEVRIAKIVGDDDEDVGLRRRLGGGGARVLCMAAGGGGQRDGGRQRGGEQGDGQRGRSHGAFSRKGAPASLA